MWSRVGNAQINNHIHKSQNENHGLSGTTLTIHTSAIDIVILNKNIPINQQTGYISQSSKNGNDNKSEPTQIFSHHHLSAKNHHKAFQNSRQTTKLIESNAHVFQL
jgi:hypothetical protein